MIKVGRTSQGARSGGTYVHVSPRRSAGDERRTGVLILRLVPMAGRHCAPVHPCVRQDRGVHDYEVLSSQTVFQGRVIGLVRDEVSMPGGTTSFRDVVVHPGAVGVVALREGGAGWEVLLVTQYRHPVRRRLDELPAGLLDVPGEPSVDAARRELAEEAGLAAGTWHVLADALTSPGMSDEAIRLFLARDVEQTPRDVQEHEELEMTSRWVLLSEAVRRVLAGELENAMACLGVLAAEVAVRDGFTGLRPADAPWPARTR